MEAVKIKLWRKPKKEGYYFVGSEVFAKIVNAIDMIPIRIHKSNMTSNVIPSNI